MRHVGQECVPLTADEINKRFPGLTISSDEYGALEPSSGLIDANLAVKTLQVSNACYGTEVFTLILKVIYICFGFVLLCLVIGLKTQAIFSTNQK